ncbi:YeeE/YedE family protein [Dyella nitratireducens]|uniref:Membrane protein n=1 Tax=Dyella nitratireducens TaxID=1849580 RepID=A0ABQ1G8T4_9GAMM|nr:YeeE/YedE family protein [Dyella nitratireducens]GGA38987.1 membrane protein [Dyella nitratireducens]GLQ40388.1 membrane protein [Dyella nitratireducens]
MHPWLFAALGGGLIGLSAVLLMGTLGRIAGISGIAAGLLSRTLAGDRAWRVCFVFGLATAPVFLRWWPDIHVGVPQVGWPWMVAAGLLVGVGTKLGSGCTSGHGVCGMARLSSRSMLATVVFMSVAIATVYVVRHVLGGLPA